MNAVIVGADRLGKIPDVLRSYDIEITKHVSGRAPAQQRKAASVLPAGTEMVILFTDFLCHNVMQRFRRMASRDGVQLICCRRSVCALEKALGQCMRTDGCENCPWRK